MNSNEGDPLDFLVDRLLHAALGHGNDRDFLRRYFRDKIGSYVSHENTNEIAEERRRRQEAEAKLSPMSDATERTIVLDKSIAKLDAELSAMTKRAEEAECQHNDLLVKCGELGFQIVTLRYALERIATNEVPPGHGLPSPGLNVVIAREALKAIL